jgi:hypothetical protein
VSDFLDSLNPDQRILFERFKTNESVSIDELTEIWPEKSRHHINLMIKYLTAKIAGSGWIIQRTSGLGRGAKGVFQMEKQF